MALIALLPAVIAVALFVATLRLTKAQVADRPCWLPPPPQC
jgi:hypothetical protein